MTSITETTMTKNRVDAMEEGQSDARPIISSERPGLSSASRIVRPTSGPFQGWHDEIEAELRYKGAVEGAAGPSDQTVDEKFHMRINGGYTSYYQLTSEFSTNMYEPWRIHEGLDFEIASMARHLIINTVTWDQLRPEHQAKLQGWAPRAKEIFASDAGKEYLFRAWIWHILDNKIFSADPSVKWLPFDDKFTVWKQVGALMSIFRRSKHIFPLRQPRWLTSDCSRVRHA